MLPSERRQRYREVLAGSECIHPASVHDAISARLAESFGFRVGMFAGSIASAAVLGAPDIVLLTLTEFVDQVRRITRASDLPLMVDADHGYGNALNVIRTVEELEAAGLAALTIEDTRLPLAFRQEKPVELISLDEMTGKLRAAVAARRDPSLTIIGRTAALQVEGLEGTVQRVKAFTETGVDAIFLVGVTSLDQIEAIHRATPLPLMLGSAPPALGDRQTLARNGVRIALQGHLPFMATVKALHDVYSRLARGNSPESLKDMVASDALVKQATAKDRYDAATREYMK